MQMPYITMGSNMLLTATTTQRTFTLSYREEFSALKSHHFSTSLKNPRLEQAVTYLAGNIKMPILYPTA
jgi:hypothetical protein